MKKLKKTAFDVGFYVLSTAALVIMLLLGLLLSIISTLVLLFVIVGNRKVKTIIMGDDYLTPTVRLSGSKLEFVFYNIVFGLFDEKD